MKSDFDIKINLMKIIKIISFQIIFLSKFSKSIIRPLIPLLNVSEEIEILLNQSYFNIGTFECLYNSFDIYPVKITIEHLNSYFIPLNYKEAEAIISYHKYRRHMTTIYVVLEQTTKFFSKIFLSKISSFMRN